MIITVSVFELKCDSCEWELSPMRAQDYWDSSEEAQETATERGWSTQGGGEGQEHYCASCTCLREGHVPESRSYGTCCERCSVRLDKAAS